VEMLVSAQELLDPENHAVVKPIHKQWVYAHFTKPIIPLAFPFSQEAPANMTYTISALAILRHLPFAVYEDDVDTLVRLLISAMAALPDWGDVNVVFQVLLRVIESRPDSLTGHLKAVVDGATAVATCSATPGRSDARAGRSSPPNCRRQALTLLAQLPSKYESPVLLPHSPLLLRVLSAACGDPVREIREVAQDARAKWNGIS